MDATIAQNNNRIAKNTLMLYVRMFLMMVVSLYTVRIILDVLGAEDYGIYNVVGGVVVMFSFLSRTLASASQRFFAFEIGRKNFDQLRIVFSIMLLLFVILILLIIILSETIGLWFVCHEMTIPLARMKAALLIYQISVLSFCYTLLAIPFQATIIAHEEMGIYAFVGILESVLLLVLALFLKFGNYCVDNLVLYGILSFISVIASQSVYIVVSLKRYRETWYKNVWDRKIANDIISYSGWNLFGSVAGVIRSQGINILINMFFNPTINAARGIAYQVNNALNHFASNFYTAVRPQITKYYAQENKEATLNLVFKSAKLTCFLFLFLALPIMVYADLILSVWLVEVPDYTTLFLRLVIITAIIDSISNPLMTLAQATGKIRLYQFVVGSLLIMNLPISWFFLYLGYQAYSTMLVAISIAIISLFARLIILKHLVDFPIRNFCHLVLLRILTTVIVSTISLIALKKVIIIVSSSNFFQLISFIVSIICSILIIVLFGFDCDEKKYITKILWEFIKKRFCIK